LDFDSRRTVQGTRTQPAASWPCRERGSMRSPRPPEPASARCVQSACVGRRPRHHRCARGCVRRSAPDRHL